jgi:hypothetical protein
VQQNELYEDVIKDDTNFLPENFFNLCAELAKIKDVATRNLLFERIIGEAQSKMTPQSELDRRRSTYYSDNYNKSAEKSKIVLYNYFRGFEKNYGAFVINGVTFKKTELTTTQQLQTIYNEPRSKKPPTFREMLRRERFTSPHAHTKEKSSQPKGPPKDTTLERNTTSL